MIINLNDFKRNEKLPPSLIESNYKNKYIKYKKYKNDSSDDFSQTSSDESDDERKKHSKLYRISTKSSNDSEWSEECCETNWTRCCFLAGLFASCLFIWLLYFDKTPVESTSDYKCSGELCYSQICPSVIRREITGNLCMDLCYTKTLKVPSCSNDLSYFSNSTYKYYNIPESDSNLICSPSLDYSYVSRIDQGITFDDFRQTVYNKIKEKLNESSTVDRIVNRLIYTTDVNHDLKLNYAEAQTLWLLLNQKYTFYMLTLAGKPYIPKIKDLCGSIVEIEEIKNHLYEKNNYSLLKSVFLNNNNWVKLKWEYKAKISLGIMEFYLDAISFNPNDEFGPESLYLCSSVESSFGYTFFNDGKLINYDYIFNGYELKEKLKDRYCQTDLDCTYTNECMTKCDITTNKCTNQLSRPQIYHFCKFLQDFFNTNLDQRKILDPLIERCLNFKSFSIDENLLFKREEMPLSFNEHKTYLEKRAYWNASQEYSLVTQQLHTTLWDWVRLAKDPVKPKKKVTKPMNKINNIKN